MNDEMNVSIRRASLALIIMLVALAAITGYWQVALGAKLAAREDNPRLVLAEQRIPRGAIQDRNGQPLAASQSAADGYARYYPEPSAAPVVGYYSMRHGLGGAEAAFDQELRGNADQTRWDVLANQLLHRVPAGRSVRLTLDISVQRAADAALGDRAGAVVVLSVPEGEVIALVSHPTFDPVTLDRDWEKLRADPTSPLVNRATQGAYQPGAAFQTFVLAEALSRDWVRITDTVSANYPVTVDGTALSCASLPITGTLAAAFAAGCPAPFDALARNFDPQLAADTIRRWQFDAPPSLFELPVHDGKSNLAALTSTQSVRELVLGQGGLLVSPLQLAYAMSVVANDGYQTAPPHLTFRQTTVFTASPVLSLQVAMGLQSALTRDASLAGQSALALSGDRRLAWFLGYAPAHAPRWVIVILLENGEAATCEQIAASIQSQLTP
jgi:peptidoglycan glycosyltransferase